MMLLLFCIINDCNASRKRNVLETRPPAAQVLLQHQTNNSAAAGHFLHMLPKRKVPASAPSKKHNDLGLQTWRFP
ncbi:hypothetical protein MIMGU_mgv1a023957mg [Erythranthe guttata]|uniref:Uncharacterized protein n=1 Tax=Erythranthe guttata TaxID=4155 RepID=A0A022QGY4_ERYGU|nr:hypothetical protein MIMGU_mgv1a023957mg [Erythranthe guttata]